MLTAFDLPGDPSRMWFSIVLSKCLQLKIYRYLHEFRSSDDPEGPLADFLRFFRINQLIIIN